MNNIKFFLMFLFVNVCIYSQEAVVKEQNQYLKNYIKFGIGRSNNYLNFGTGVFFPLSEKFMLGTRLNVNSEINVFKTPNEALLDISLSARYIPLIRNNFVVITGVGIGYANINKRGKFIKKQFISLVEEYELEKHKSISAIAEVEAGIFLTKFLGVSAAAYSVFTSKKNIYTYQIGFFIYGLNNP